MEISKYLTPGRSRTVFWIALAGGTLLRVLVLVLIFHAPLTSDASDYCEVARMLRSGVHFSPYWPPGLPLFLLPFVALGCSDAMLRVPMLAFWLCLAWAELRLFRALGLERLAGPVLLIVSLTPAFLYMSGEPLTSMPAAALLLTALSATVLCMVEAGWAEYLLLGASLGWLALTRPSAAPLLMLLPAVIVYRTRRWKGPVLSCLLGLSLLGGWMVKAHQLSGAWIINTSNGKNLWYGNNPWTPLYRTWYFGSHAKPGSAEAARLPAFEAADASIERLPALAQPGAFQAAALADIRQHPGRFLLRTLNRVRCYFGYDTFTTAQLAKRSRGLAGVSLLVEIVLYLLLLTPAVFWLGEAGASFWRRTEVWAIAGSVLLYAIPYWLSMSHPTYNFPVILPIAALGAAAWHWRTESRRPRLRGWIVTCIFLLIQVEWTLRMAAARG